MSVFTAEEIAYLRGQTMGRLATIGRDGQPQIAPMTYVFNADEDSIDLGGIDFANTQRWRNIQHNPLITFLIDDFAPTGAHAVEIRGRAEIHQTGGSTINPRFPHFVEQWVRLRPSYVVSWGLDAAAEGPDRFRPHGRRVG